LKKAIEARRVNSAAKSNRIPVSAFDLPLALSAEIDVWAKREGVHSRSGAIEQLLQKALAASAKTLPSGADGPEMTRKISDIAGKQIDSMADPTATDEERASRKRRLLKGPSEFRQMRSDRKKI
jgi:hypothetical protein